MSIKLIRDALEAGLVDLTHGALSIAWENKVFRPTVGQPYLRAHMLPAQTQNPSMGSVELHNRETGIFQVDVFFPVGVGTAGANGWVETVRNGFKRGSAFASGGVTVRILRHPSVATAMQYGDWLMVPVSISYQADIFV